MTKDPICGMTVDEAMSIMVGVGRAAQAGVLIKNADALERTEKVRVLVTVKTGTLTAGKPRVTSRSVRSGEDETRLLALAAALELSSEHPLTRAIVDAAKEEGAVMKPVQDFQSTTGGGVSGTVEGKLNRVGKEKFLSEAGVKLPDDLQQESKELQEKAQTVVWVAVGNEAIGLLGISDPIKGTTPAAIQALRL